jgi:WD40 repeat protein
VNAGCPDYPAFIPGSRQIAAYTDPHTIVIWDSEKNKPIREFKSNRPIGQFLVSPDGTLLVAAVANDPQDTPDYNQDFIIWDISTGAVAYESPKVKWNPMEKLSSAFSKSGLQLNGFSSDGRCLLVTRHKRLTIYEVSDKSTEN